MSFVLLTLIGKTIAGYRLLHHFKDLDCLCCRSDLVFVMVQDEQAAGPVLFEARVADSNRNIGAFAGCQQNSSCGECDWKRVSLIAYAASNR